MRNTRRAILLLLIVNGCRESTNNSLKKLTAELQDLSGKQTTVELTTITSKSWSELYVVGPYTAFEDLPNFVALDQRFVDTGIDKYDSIAVLAYAFHREVSEIVAIPRGVVDLAPLAGSVLKPPGCIRVEGSPPRATSCSAADAVR